MSSESFLAVMVTRNLDAINEHRKLCSIDTPNIEPLTEKEVELINEQAALLYSTCLNAISVFIENTDKATIDSSQGHFEVFPLMRMAIHTILGSYIKTASMIIQERATVIRPSTYADSLKQAANASADALELTMGLFVDEKAEDEELHQKATEELKSMPTAMVVSYSEQVKGRIEEGERLLKENSSGAIKPHLDALKNFYSAMQKELASRN